MLLLRETLETLARCSCYCCPPPACHVFSDQECKGEDGLMGATITTMTGSGAAAYRTTPRHTAGTSINRYSRDKPSVVGRATCSCAILACILCAVATLRTFACDPSGAAGSIWPVMRIVRKPVVSLLNRNLTALAIDATVPADLPTLCPYRPDSLSVPYDTLPELLAHWSNRSADTRPEVQALRKRRYFIASLQRDTEPIFGSWQRELLKVLYLLGNESLSNVFVSLFESNSADATPDQLAGAAELFDALGVPHRVLLGHRMTDLPDRKSMSRIGFLALLRNIALQPLFSGESGLFSGGLGGYGRTGANADADRNGGGSGSRFGFGFGGGSGGSSGGGAGDGPYEYDVVLYLNDILFCASDVMDLARTVRPGSGTGAGGPSIDADMSCAVDYIPRTPGQDQQDEVRVYDTWVLHDMLGINFNNDRPYSCDDSTVDAMDSLRPFEVFSCWNGMVAMDADIFQKAGVRFRAAHAFECELSECELIGRDLRALNRGRIIMVPTARTAYNWEVFRQIAGLPHPPLPSPLALAGGRFGGSGAPKEPADAVCCSLDRNKDNVLMENCFMQKRWRLAYDIFGVPLAPAPGELEVSFRNVPATDEELFEATAAWKGGRALPSEKKRGGRRSLEKVPVPAPPQLQRAPKGVEKEEEEEEWPRRRLAVSAAAEAGAGAPGTAVFARIPRRVMHWAADAEVWADDAQTIMTLSRLSHAGVNHDFEHVVVSDAALDKWAAVHPPAAAASGAGGKPEKRRDLKHAFRNDHVRLGYQRLQYMYEHGGVFVPTASQAGRPFSEVLGASDELVVGVAANATSGERHLLFLAAAARSRVLADILNEAAKALWEPARAYRRLWAAAARPGARRPPEELEHHFFTGVEMILDVIRNRHHSAPGVRVLTYGMAEVRFDVTRPKAECDALREREAFAAAVGVLELPDSVTTAAEAIDGGGAGDGSEPPVYFDPEAPHNVAFSGRLLQGQRLGVHRNQAVDSLPRGRQLLCGQYLMASLAGEAAAASGVVWSSVAVSECAPIEAAAAADAAAAGTRPVGGERCFLWLRGDGVLAVYAGMGLVDPAARQVARLAEPRADANVTFMWLTLQDLGNIVLYGANATNGETVPLWASRSVLPPDCQPGSACHAAANMAFSGGLGRVELRRGDATILPTALPSQ
ncbi:unnamed protein product [Phaeothamnion confervicola]